LFFVGNTRKSSSILKKQIKKTQEKNQKTLNALHSVKHLAESLYDSLNNSDISKFGELLDAGWIAKKKFSSNVSNIKIDSIYDYALKNGAIGGKITGAGGGGHLILYCNLNKQKSLIEKLGKKGLTHIPFSFYDKKPQVINLANFVE
jgi:D-glycero-alpha-D-manno-heptose-7-phosphate kinase